ncbi:MAG: hypothetical protein HUJ58_09225 [Erysipelotrichaceae bacterium]|nr:hypothetical protein [Erysipelotrichaceae bacterium]
MRQVLGLLGVLGTLGSLYAVLYYFNKKTPEPEGCEEIQNSCSGCGITSCGRHPSHMSTEE